MAAEPENEQQLLPEAKIEEYLDEIRLTTIYIRFEGRHALLEICDQIRFKLLSAPNVVDDIGVKLGQEIGQEFDTEISHGEQHSIAYYMGFALVCQRAYELFVGTYQHAYGDEDVEILISLNQALQTLWPYEQTDREVEAGKRAEEARRAQATDARLQKEKHLNE